MQMRGSLNPDNPFSVPPDLFFFTEPADEASEQMMPLQADAVMHDSRVLASYG